jgi:hypothetical protein
MATFRSFEEIDVWRKSRELVKEIYIQSKQNIFYRDIGLSEQIRRASISIMSNIAEGLERNGKKEFLQFLSLQKFHQGKFGRTCTSLSIRDILLKINLIN